MAIYDYITEEAKFYAVLEAYFGKTPTLLEIEQQIGVIRQNAIKKYSEINRSEEVLKLNRLFEKQFGMDVFSLHIDKSGQVNAYTIPVALRFDIAFNQYISKKVEATKEGGFRFKPNNGLSIICTVNYGLISNPNFTDGEILAVILHELGHNFADAFNKCIETMNKNIANYLYYQIIYQAIIGTCLTLVVGGIFVIPAAIEKIRGNKSSVLKKREQRTRKRRFVSFLGGVQASLRDMGDFVNSVQARFSSKHRERLKRYKDYLAKRGYEKDVKDSGHRYNEVIADKFAGIYGYGPEQGSALMKMEKLPSKAEKFVEGLPGGSAANQDFNDIVKDFYRFDCHPHIIQRINEEIKLLKYELEKSDLDPRLVKAMKSQVKELEQMKNESMKVYEEMSHNDKARAEFFRFVNTKDPDAVSDKVEEEINKAFDSFFKDE